MLKRILPLLMFLPLAACMSPKFQSGNELYVTYSNVMKPTIGEAAQMAQGHCAQYGKSAAPQPDDTPDGLRTFDCK